MSTLASLRGSIEKIEAPGDVHALSRIALGHRTADAMLRGALPAALLDVALPAGWRVEVDPVSLL